ncbi:MAG: putative endonuclease [Solirubrobacteraceae bacterium]|jgi:putative endonuclease|nr:putative endonuclease [Solirubrobacteraceae bacterium]
MIRAGRGESPHVPAAYVYLLRCRDGSLYCGWSTDVPRRVAVHERGRGSRYVASRLPVQLVYVRALADAGEARREEARIKRLTRAQKLALVAAQGPPARVAVGA